VRAPICEGLGFLGIELDDPRSAAGADLISGKASHASVRVIRSDEKLMIAGSAQRLILLGRSILIKLSPAFYKGGYISIGQFPLETPRRGSVLRGNQNVRVVFSAPAFGPADPLATGLSISA
jgi:hypothetical protein